MADGMQQRSENHSRSTSQPALNVVMLHGFGQTGRCLGPLADRIAVDHHVLTPDLPGHGDRAPLADMTCPAAAAYLAELHGRGTWIGYSMGGRIALHVALNRPDVLEALVLIGATAGLAGPRERAERRALDDVRATDLEALGVEEFTARWLAMEMFAGLPDWARFEAERARNTVDGLAGSLRNAGTGSMEPLWGRLAELNMPVLLLSGARDAAFGELAERMAAAIGPNADTAVIAGAGHAAHLEAPAAVHRALREHLALR